MDRAALGSISYPPTSSEHCDRMHIAGLRRRLSKEPSRLQVPLVNAAILASYVDRPSRVRSYWAECHELSMLRQPANQCARTQVPDSRPVSSPNDATIIWSESDLAPNGGTAVTGPDSSC